MGTATRHSTRSDGSEPRNPVAKKLARFALVALVLLTGCPRASHTTPEGPSIEDLRERARSHPNDGAAIRAWALAELLWEAGDPEQGTTAITRARELLPEDGTVALFAGLDAYFHGQPAVSLDAFLAALEHAEEPAVQEVAAAGLEELVELAPNFPQSVPRLQATTSRLSPGAKQAVTDLLVDMAYRRGEAEAVASVASEMGCVTSWRVAGPFGPRDLLGFDREHPAQGTGPMAAEYDLGAGRGVRPTRDIEARGCRTHLGEGPIAEGGTTYAEATIESAGGTHVLRLETPNAVELRVDGETVVSIDSRRLPLQRVSFHRLELSAGTHELEVKVTTRHPNPVLRVSLTPGTETSEAPEGDDPVGCYLRSSLAMSRGDVVGARQSLRTCEDAPLTLALKAAVALSDPNVTNDMRRDEARQHLAAIAAEDPRAWLPVTQLARLAAAEGRDAQAIESLRGALDRWPELSSVPMALAELLLNRGWDAEAVEHIERALEVAPGTCTPIQAALAQARRRDLVARIDRYTDMLMECNARDTARFGQLSRARRWEEAQAELERLASLEPPQARARLLASHLDLAEGRGDTDATLAILTELAELHPRSDVTRLAIADRSYANDPDAAVAALTTAVTEEPAAMADLRRIRTALGGESEFEGFRVDGAEAIAEFEESGAEYADRPQVLVFDYTVHRVFPGGASLALTHQIYKVQSEEAVDELGEFAVPQGAYVLTLHTIKEDGTVLEPDLIENKETISLPELAVGDYVEQEYIRVLDPPEGIPGGLLGDRFYFASFEAPFFRTELVALVPQGMEVVVDPRGPAPQTQRSTLDDGTQVFRWRVDRSDPLVREPGSVAPREYIPSVNWGVNATWGAFLAGLRDVLADREQIDPAAVRLADEIIEGATTDEEKARKLYYWVLENMENTNEVFSPAAPMLAGRNGNRARVLHYLLRLVGVESSLILVRGFGADQTESELADEETYANLILRVGEGADPTYLMTTARGVPYGYVSPALRGMDALVLSPVADPQRAEVIRLPAATGDEDSRRIEVDVDVAADGSGRVTVVETFLGSGAIEWRNDLEGIPAAVLEQRFEEGYAARIVPGARLVSLELEGRDEPEGPFVMRYVMEASALARRQGDRLVLSGLFPTILAPRFASVASRTTTQVVGPPLYHDVTLRVRTAEGAPSVSLQDVTLQAGDARFASTASTEDGALVIRRSLEVPLMRVAPSDYEAWAAFCRAVDEAEARDIPL